MSATITGIAPEPGSRARGRWVAIWRTETDKATFFTHVTLPCLMGDTSREEARTLAEKQGPPMK